MKETHQLYTISFGEFCERLSYYGLQSIFVLFLSKVFLFSDVKSYSLFGIFAALSFAMPLLGGIVADKWLGQRKSVILGSFLLILGNLTLVSSQLSFFYMGLSAIICGTGLYKANCTSLIGAMYKQNNLHRENGYRFFYVAMNIGGMLGPIIYGLAYKEINWHLGFLISAILISITLSLFLTQFKPEAYKENVISPRQYVIAILSVLICTLIFGLLLIFNNLSEYLMPIIFIILISSVFLHNRKNIEIERQKILLLIISFIFMALFFSASLQVVSSISMFIDRSINKNILGYSVPTIMFSSLYPLSVILLAPFISAIWKILAKNNKTLSSIAKVAVSLLFAALAFLCFYFSAQTCFSINHYWAIFWLAAGNLCLGAGEICLMPAVMSSVTNTVPANLQGTAMGFMFLFVALGAYLSSLIAKLSDTSMSLVSNFQTTANYENFFVEIFLAVSCALILLLMINQFCKFTLTLKENIPCA